MTEAVQIWQKPDAREVAMIAGWRQWADAGSVSSGLPAYLIETLHARHIGQLSPDGFYIFQVPGAHDLMRPVVRFSEGYPSSLEGQKNELYYTGDAQRGLVIFLGDEPQLDVERYLRTLLDTAQQLGVKRIVGLGGVYGEVPYDRERTVSANYSLPGMKDEINRLAVNLSDYEGGASIGSYLCRRAGDRGMEYVGMYSFVPAYDFTGLSEEAGGIRLENDYTAWLGLMRRILFMLKMPFDLADLEEKSKLLKTVIASKIEEIEEASPQMPVREYLDEINAQFHEQLFYPLDEVWDEELKRLLNRYDDSTE
jgi:proteasome assembly chaperone (PAC2) family protein